MFGPPKSLTAMVHVKFHYGDEDEVESEFDGAELEMMGKILERASKMEPDMQAILVKFVDFLQKAGRKEDGQRP